MSRSPEDESDIPKDLEYHRIGPFELLEESGRGASGIVYLARDSRLNRRVALKVLWPRLEHNSTVLERFYKEAKAAARVESPYVVQIYEADKADGYHYIAMEHVPGPSLSLILAARSMESEATTVMTHVLRGLRAAHAKQVTHGDIKPSNILYDEASNIYKLTDFGLAGFIEEASLTQVGEWVGTPEYASPETASGKQPDVRSDLYSAGVVFYRLLTGRLPYHAETPIGYLESHQRGGYAKPREHGIELNLSLNAVLDGLLATEPAHRYPTAQSVLEDLACCLQGKELSSVRLERDAPAWVAEPASTPLVKPLTREVVAWFRMKALEVAGRSEETVMLIAGAREAAERKYSESRMRLIDLAGARDRIEIRIEAHERAGQGQPLDSDQDLTAGSEDRDTAAFELIFSALRAEHTALNDEISRQEIQVDEERRRLEAATHRETLLLGRRTRAELELSLLGERRAPDRSKRVRAALQLTAVIALLIVSIVIGAGLVWTLTGNTNASRSASTDLVNDAVLNTDILPDAEGIIHEIPLLIMNLQTDTEVSFAGGGSLMIRYIIDSLKPESIVIRVFNSDGQLQRTIGPILQARGVHGQKWDGRDDRGEIVSEGAYAYQIARFDAPIQWQAAPEDEVSCELAGNPEIYSYDLIRLQDGRMKLYFNAYIPQSHEVAVVSISTRNGDTITTYEDGTVATTDAQGRMNVDVSHPHIPPNKISRPDYRLYSATSLDGISWALDEGVRMEDGVVKNVYRLLDGKVLLYFAKHDSNGMSLHAAMSTDGIHFDMITHDSALPDSVRISPRVDDICIPEKYPAVPDTPSWQTLNLNHCISRDQYRIVAMPNGQRRHYYMTPASRHYYTIVSSTTNAVGNVIVRSGELARTVTFRDDFPNDHVGMSHVELNDGYLRIPSSYRKRIDFEPRCSIRTGRTRLISRVLFDHAGQTVGFNALPPDQAGLFPEFLQAMENSVPNSLRGARRTTTRPPPVATDQDALRLSVAFNFQALANGRVAACASRWIEGRPDTIYVRECAATSNQFHTYEIIVSGSTVSFLIDSISVGSAVISGEIPELPITYTNQVRTNQGGLMIDWVEVDKP